VDRPDVNGRLEILRIHAKDVALGEDVNLEKIAARTPGFVGADLANLLNEAALLAARRDLAAVTLKEIDDAVDRIIAGLEKKNRLINEKERTIVAYHEAGHAIVAERVPTADPVHKISIIPRGVAALGYTQQLPTEDRYLLTKQELMDRIAVLLGGRVAEEIVFNEISTGAGNDLERVTELARSMVMEYGMSRELGPVNLSGPRRSQFLQGARRAAATTPRKRRGRSTARSTASWRGRTSGCATSWSPTGRSWRCFRGGCWRWRWWTRRTCGASWGCRRAPTTRWRSASWSRRRPGPAATT
jgi:cell division protease FtsH